MKKVFFLFLIISNTLFLFGQTTYDWLDTAPDGNWRQGVGGARWNPGGLWDQPPPTQILRFNNNNQLIMTNNVDGEYSIHQIIFGNSNTTSRTISGNNVIFNDFSTNKPKIENSSSATHIIQFPLKFGYNPMEINPVSGNLTVSSIINNNGNFLDVYGNNGKRLILSGSLSGTGGISLKQNSTLELSGVSKSYSGNTNIEAGVLELSVSVSSNTIIISSGAKVVINGENVDINNLTINSGGILEILPGKSLTVNGTLTNNAGNTGIVIKSDASGSGSLITASGVNATVERYIAAATWGEGDDGWHLISSPVAAQSISGSWSPTGEDNDYDFYGWNESGNLWMNHKDAGFSTWNGGNNFNIGQGYMAAYQQTGTKTFVGALNNAAVTKNNLSITSGNYSGWHLVGNPFSSAIDWSNANWVKTGFLSTAKVWVEADKAYKDVTNDYSNIIPSANGFWVKANNATNTLTIPLQARTHNSLDWLKSGTSSGYIILTARDIEGNSAQESIIRIDPNATDGFDTDYDAQFMSGYAPMFYSVVESQYVSLNTLPELENKIINLGFVKNNAQEFSIELNTEHNIPGREIYLTDLKTGAVANLTDGQPYLFTSEEGDEPNRFMLNFSMVGIEDQPESDKISIYGNQRSIFISYAPANSTITLTSITGQVVMRAEATGSGLTTLNAEKLPKGVYVVSLIAGGKQISRKVVL